MKHPHIKITSLITALAFMVLTAPSAMAWGPTNRPTYTNEHPANHAVFNSITNNAAVGDERDFVRVAEKKADGSAVYRSDISVEPGKEYEVYIYYHNDASSTYNDAAHNYVGVARNTRLRASFPSSLKAGERGTIVGEITSSTTDPEAVWDEAYITATADMTLHYVAASARIYNDWETSGSVLSTNLFSAQGTFLGSSELSGVINGCDEFSGQVVFTILTKAVEDEEPVVSETPVETPDTPEVPEELPTTGPAEIVLAVVVVLAVGAGVFYYVQTHKAVKKATRKARGRK